MKNKKTFKTVKEFENKISLFFNAPFVVTTDCCTHAIELCLRELKPKKLSIPKHTYLSIPMTAKKLQISWEWNSDKWINYYNITPQIIDAAVFWKENGYIPGTFMCLSFQYKKHLNLGRGGAILFDDEKYLDKFQKLSYDGRNRNLPWAEQNISEIGYHYYMTPETARLGIKKIKKAIKKEPKVWSYADYPDLTKLNIFSKDSFSE